MPTLECGVDEVYIMDCANNEGESEARSKTTDESQEDTEDEFDGKYGIEAVGIANSTGSVKVVRSDEAILHDIYGRYLAAGEKAQDECGVTLMLRDIPYRLQVEPDIVDLLRQTCDMEHVDYIYLPMNIDILQRIARMKRPEMRNRGYCFIHFSVPSTAQAFASRIHDHVAGEILGGKHITVSRAKFQGLCTNLMNVLDISSKKWRPKNGFAHIRGSNGDLVCVGLLPLRNLLRRKASHKGAKHQRCNAPW
jgi:hypothetical protein